MKIGTLVFYKKSFKTSPIGVYHFFGIKRRSYAGSIVKRIYDYFCGGAKNLFLEYLLCYRKEYESYKQFLLEKYINSPEIKKFLIAKKEMYIFQFLKQKLM